MDAALLAECASRTQLIDFSRGALMTRQGDVADGFFVLTRGSAEVLVELPDGSEKLIDVFAAGDCVGDLAILLGQPRTATVRAIRDCQAARLSNADFTWLLGAAPEFTLRLARKMGDRLQRTTRERPRARSIASVTAVSLSFGPDTQAFFGAFAQALADLPGPPVSFTAGGEASHEKLVEADAILLVVEAGTPPNTKAVRRVMDQVRDMKPRREVSLVLLHAGDAPPRGALAWLRDRRLRAWHHARPGDAGDLARIARRITGSATGLALSGGGARGFAHIGVLRAFEEAGIPVDFIAGTSMGAIVAAQYSAGYTTSQMIDLMVRGYVKPSGFPDLAVPTVAIYSGRSTEKKLKGMFGDRRMEDLRIPCFTVSADLRTAETVIQETGRVWRATRTSCSIPGVLPPLPWRGRLLVDGGLLDNLPVDALRQRCHGRIVASDVSVAVEFEDMPARKLWPFGAKTKLPGIAQIMMRTAQLASVRDSRDAGTPADIYLNPNLHDVGMSDFSRIDEIIERGAAFARKRLQGWTQ